MSEHPAAERVTTPVTSFDQPGSGGYDLSARFDALKAAMRRADWHGHLETTALRTAVLPPAKRRRPRAARRALGARTQPAES